MNLCQLHPRSVLLKEPEIALKQSPPAAPTHVCDETIILPAADEIDITWSHLESERGGWELGVRDVQLGFDDDDDDDDLDDDEEEDDDEEDDDDDVDDDDDDFDDDDDDLDDDEEEEPDDEEDSVK